MKILKISREKYDEEYRRLLETYNIYVTEMEPSILSAMTAMKIAKQFDKENFDYVIVENTKDAMASLSAKKITKQRKHKTIYRTKPNTRPGTGLTKEIAEGIDGWIFASEAQRGAYSPTLRNATIIEYIPIVLTELDRKKNDKLTISWIGNIDRPERLKVAVDQVDDANPEFILNICGTGNARNTMPVVRWSRSIQKNQNIVWAGENYDTKRELGHSDAVIKTNEDLTPTEYLALYNGIPVIEPDEINKRIEKGLTHTTNKPDQKANIEKIISYLINI